MADTLDAIVLPRSVDWARIEADYRAGRRTIRAIAEDHGISHAAVQKRAKRDEWPRDISGKIAAKAEAEVAKLAVTKPGYLTTLATEREIIAANVQAQVAVITEARRDVRLARGTVRKIWDELEALTLSSEQHEALAELAALETVQDADPQRLAKAVQAIRTATGFPNRVQAAAHLAQALDRMITLEYRVMGIRDAQPDAQPVAANSPAEDEAWRELRDKVRTMSAARGGNGG